MRDPEEGFQLSETIKIPHHTTSRSSVGPTKIQWKY